MVSFGYLLKIKMTEMKRQKLFKIIQSYAGWDEYNVEAESKDEAVEMVNDGQCTPDDTGGTNYEIDRIEEIENDN